MYELNRIYLHIRLVFSILTSKNPTKKSKCITKKIFVHLECPLYYLLTVAAMQLRRVTFARCGNN